jgi:hypothetical protein
MARMKLAVFVSQLAGKLGPVVAASGHYGQYLRAKVVPHNPSSVLQQAHRARITNYSQAWRNLTDAQRTAWAAFGLQVNRRNTFGEAFKYTGFNIFMRCNINRAIMGKTQLSNPPLLVYAQELISLVAGTFNANNLTLQFAPTPLGTKDHLFIWSTPSQSAGKNFLSSEYRYLTQYPEATTEPDIVDTWTSYWNVDAPTVGERIGFVLYTVHEDSGLPNMEHEVTQIVTAV